MLSFEALAPYQSMGEPRLGRGLVTRFSLAFGWLVGALAAPLQCGGVHDDPELRSHETPDEALYRLAQRFEREGQVEAWRTTLAELVERYPNSRHAVRAREDLAAAEGRRP